MAALAVVACGALAVADDRGGAPLLSLPLDCTAGETCFIQSHVDMDPGPGVRDFRCGSASYDGHKGIDFRLLSAAEVSKGIAVRAAADGVIKGVRDGMADVFPDAAARRSIAGKECGNGVVIDHGGGWETQYCHMRKGSLTAMQGQTVKRGDKIGEVGYSGLAELAHLHISVRFDGKPVDPMSGAPLGQSCFTSTAVAMAHSLWDKTVLAAFSYQNGEIIGSGFAGGPVDHRRLEVDHHVAPPQPESRALIFYARAANLKSGDRIAISITGPGDFKFRTVTEPLTRNKAIYLAYAGRRLKAHRWPPGRYEGGAELLREGREVLPGKRVVFDMP